MLIIGEEPECQELRHVKGDDFHKFIDAVKEDGTAFDASGFVFQWVISDPTDTIVTINGIVTDSEIEFSEPAASFSSINYIGEYTHELRETTTNTTLARGPFKLI